MNTIPLSGVEAFLYAEARALDDRDWDTWLAFYSPDASFWMPAWDDNDRLVENPQAEISLIYYARRSGLEDRPGLTELPIRDNTYRLIKRVRVQNARPGHRLCSCARRIRSDYYGTWRDRNPPAGIGGFRHHD